MRRALGLFALLALALAQPFALEEEERVFAGVYLPLENPALLEALPAPRLYYRVGLRKGARFSAGAGAVWADRGFALGGELGYPLWGSGYLGFAREGLGLAAAFRLPGDAFGLGLGAVREGQMGWGWLWVRGGRPGLSLYYRRPWGAGFGLFGLQLGDRSGTIRALYGRAFARREERLWLWGGAALSRLPSASGLGLGLNARWQAPLFGGPVLGGLFVQGGLELSLPDAGAVSLRLLPLVVRADWRIRLYGGELRLFLPGARLELVDGRYRFVFGFGAEGWLALR